MNWRASLRFLPQLTTFSPKPTLGDHRRAAAGDSRRGRGQRWRPAAPPRPGAGELRVQSAVPAGPRRPGPARRGGGAGRPARGRAVDRRRRGDRARVPHRDRHPRHAGWPRGADRPGRPACARSDALRGRTVPAARPDQLAAAPGWPQARAALAAQLTARLAAAAGATVSFYAERPSVPAPHPPSVAQPEDVAAGQPPGPERMGLEGMGPELPGLEGLGWSAWRCREGPVGRRPVTRAPTRYGSRWPGCRPAAPRRARRVARSAGGGHRAACPGQSRLCCSVRACCCCRRAALGRRAGDQASRVHAAPARRTRGAGAARRVVLAPGTGGHGGAPRTSRRIRRVPGGAGSADDWDDEHDQLHDNIEHQQRKTLAGGRGADRARRRPWATRDRRAQPPVGGRARYEGNRLTSSAALKDRDSSRDLRSRCRFAVHRPGIPEASPRSHGMPCRGSVPGSAGARLALAGSLKVSYRTDILREVKRRFLPGLKAGVWSPQSR